MSVTDFARKCNIKQPVMDRYLKGYEPKVVQMMKICTAYGCLIDWLVGFSDIGEPNLGLSESEWQKRAMVAEQKLEKYDGYLDLVVHRYEEMLKGIQDIAKMRKQEAIK